MTTKRVLVVDDSFAVRRAVSLMLGEGFILSEAADGEEALRILREQEIDLVLTDLHMPKMDGFDLIEEMRLLDDKRFTPVLVLTTECRDDVIQSLKHAGVTGVLQKPIERGALREAVRRCMQ